MSREQVEFLRLDDVPAAPFAAAGFSHGLRAGTLSREPGPHGARSMLVQGEPYWCCRDSGYLACDLEVLMLHGDLSVGDSRLARGSYAFLPAGLQVRGMETHAGFSALWMTAGPCELTVDCKLADQFNPQRAVGPLDVNGVDWQPTPDYPGRPREEATQGLHVRILRSDPETGAYTLMARHDPGWSDPRLEAHETWEELILLEGDCLMGETGMVTSGSYIFRPGEKPHGPQATRGGAVWFCRGEKEIDFQFTQPEWTQPRCEQTLASAAPEETPALWGRWA